MGIVVQFPRHADGMRRRFRRAESIEQQMEILRDYIGLDRIDELLDHIDKELENREQKSSEHKE